MAEIINYPKVYFMWRYCGRQSKKITTARVKSNNEFGFYTLYARPKIMALYRRFTGRSSGRWVSLVGRTSREVERAPTLRNLRATVKALESLSNIYVTSINCTNLRVTAYYKLRKYRRFFAVTM